MSWTAVAIAGGTIVGGLLSSQAQKSSGSKAADAQIRSTEMGIDEQRRQFDAVQKLLSPFVGAGTTSLGKQGDLIGLNGNDAQQAAIQQLQQSPLYTSQLKLGENRILANASATGGLRGGNTQAALAQFAPQLLAQTINDQYNRLGGLTSLGQNAAAGVGNAGMQLGSNVSNLMQQAGAAQAGAAINSGKADIGLYNSASNAWGQYVGSGGRFGGSTPTPDAVQGGFSQTPAGSAGFGTGLAYGNQDFGAFI